MGAPLGDPEPSRSLFTCGGLGRILNGEAVLGWVQEPAEEIGETLKDRVVGAWTWGLGGILGESGGGVLRKTEQAWPRHVCASQSSEPVVLGTVEGWGPQDPVEHLQCTPRPHCHRSLQHRLQGKTESEASSVSPRFYCDPQPEILTLPKFKDILLITNFSSTVWLEVRANTSETPQK